MCGQRRIQTRSAHDRDGPTDSLGRAGAESYTATDGRARSNGRARRADGAKMSVAGRRARALPLPPHPTGADGRARSNGRARRAHGAPIHRSSNPPGPNPPNTNLLLRLTTAPGTPATQGPRSTSCGPADHPRPASHTARRSVWPPCLAPASGQSSVTPGDDGGRRSRTALTNMSGGADGCVRCG